MFDILYCHAIVFLTNYLLKFLHDWCLSSYFNLNFCFVYTIFVSVVTEKKTTLVWIFICFWCFNILIMSCLQDVYFIKLNQTTKNFLNILCKKHIKRQYSRENSEVSANFWIILLDVSFYYVSEYHESIKIKFPSATIPF